MVISFVSIGLISFNELHANTFVFASPLSTTATSSPSLTFSTLFIALSAPPSYSAVIRIPFSA